MKITFDIPDGQAAQIVEGMCAATGWTAASGVTQAQWAKDAVVKYIKDTAKRGQVKQAMSSIAATVEAASIT